MTHADWPQGWPAGAPSPEEVAAALSLLTPQGPLPRTAWEAALREWSESEPRGHKATEQGTEQATEQATELAAERELLVLTAEDHPGHYAPLQAADLSLWGPAGHHLPTLWREFLDTQGMALRTQLDRGELNLSEQIDFNRARLLAAQWRGKGPHEPWWPWMSPAALRRLDQADLEAYLAWLWPAVRGEQTFSDLGLSPEKIQLSEEIRSALRTLDAPSINTDFAVWLLGRGFTPVIGWESGPEQDLPPVPTGVTGRGGVRALQAAWSSLGLGPEQARALTEWGAHPFTLRAQLHLAAHQLTSATTGATTGVRESALSPTRSWPTRSWPTRSWPTRSWAVQGADLQETLAAWGEALPWALKLPQPESADPDVTATVNAAQRHWEALLTPQTQESPGQEHSSVPQRPGRPAVATRELERALREARGPDPVELHPSAPAPSGKPGPMKASAAWGGIEPDPRPRWRQDTEGQAGEQAPKVGARHWKRRGAALDWTGDVDHPWSLSQESPYPALTPAERRRLGARHPSGEPITDDALSRVLQAALRREVPEIARTRARPRARQLAERLLTTPISDWRAAAVLRAWAELSGRSLNELLEQALADQALANQE